MDILERTSQISLLEAALGDARAGNGCLALVFGEAGIGKTALLQQFTMQHRHTTRVLWGACDALFTPRPLGPLYDMLPLMSGELPKVLASGSLNAAIFPAMLDELQKRPTIVVFEDAHWADEATLDLLRYLGRRISQTSALLVISYRDDELGLRHPLRGLLGEMSSSSITRRISLPPLSKSAVQTLVDSQDVNVDAAALYRQTGGNPFFVIEALVNPGGGIPASVRDAVLARAARLSISAYAVLEAAAIIGQHVELWLLEAVTGAEAYTAEECMHAGMLLAQDNRLVFRHELTRETILEAISPSRRQVLHRLVLDALKSSPHAGSNLARLVHHAQAAGDREAILSFAPLACEAARRSGMPRTESVLWTLMIQYADQLPLLQQAEIFENYGLSCRALPDKSVSINAYRKALELARQAEAPALTMGSILVRLATMLVTNAQVEEAVSTIDTALAVLEPLPPSLPLALAYKNRAYQLLIRGDYDACVDYAQKGYALAEALGDIYTIMSTLDTLGLCWLPIDHQRGRQYMEQTLALTLEHKGYWRAGSVYPNLSITYVDIYQLDQAERLIEAGLRFTGEHDNDLAHAVLLAWKGMLKMYTGEWLEADQIAAELIAEPGLPLICQPAVLVTQGRLLARRGAPGSSEVLDRALEISRKINNLQRIGVVYTARAEAAWLANDPKKTLEEVESFYEVAIKNRQPGFAAELAYWRWRAGDRVETFDWMVRPFVLEIQGDWQGAADAWDALGCPYEQARALANGDSAAQIAALTIFEQMGALPMAHVVRQQLRHAGVRNIPRWPRLSTRKNPSGLTDRQVEILALLADRMTNAEIAAHLYISPKTTGHHVSAILARLGVSSREEAADLFRKDPAFWKS